MGVVKDATVEIAEPPTATSYHLYVSVPVAPVAFKTEEDPEQIEEGKTEGDSGGVQPQVFTVIVISL